jgi:hypothetical protein
MRGMIDDTLEQMALVGAGHGCVCGRVVGFSEDLRPLVEYPGRQSAPVPARTLTHCRDDVHKGSEVLLLFERQYPASPIIAGVFSNAPAREAPLKLSVDGKRVTLEAHDEIALKCGQSSIVLRGDGKIVIKGAEIVSRASGTNKVRGACVKIN